MYAGTVEIKTKMVEHGIRFPTFQYKCDHSYVTQCELATEDGNEIKAIITLKNVPSAHEVEDMALAVHKRAMRRLECLYGMQSGESQILVRNLRSEINPENDILVARGSVAKASVGKVSVIVDKSSNELRSILERPFFEADIYFELFDQAKNSLSEVVEFLGNY